MISLRTLGYMVEVMKLKPTKSIAIASVTRPYENLVMNPPAKIIERDHRES